MFFTKRILESGIVLICDMCHLPMRRIVYEHEGCRPCCIYGKNVICVYCFCTFQNTSTDLPIRQVDMRADTPSLPEDDNGPPDDIMLSPVPKESVLLIHPTPPQVFQFSADM